MTRTAAREIAIQLEYRMAMNRDDPAQALPEFFQRDYYDTLAGEDKLYAEYPDDKQLAYIHRLIHGLSNHREELNASIEKYARNWKVGRISKIATSIIRTAMYEIRYMDDVPDAAAINEAVELAKGYEEPETVSFINGILGSFVRDERGMGPKEELNLSLDSDLETDADQVLDSDSDQDFDSDLETDLDTDIFFNQNFKFDLYGDSDEESDDNSVDDSDEESDEALDNDSDDDSEME